MSEERKGQQPQDDRPEYEPPRALRLSDMHDGMGECNPGSGDTGICSVGGGAGGKCAPGSSAGTDCTMPGSGVEI